MSDDRSGPAATSWREQGLRGAAVHGTAPPAPTPRSAAQGVAAPLNAFQILRGGDVLDTGRGTPPPEGLAAARAFVEQRLHIEPHGAAAELVARVEADVVRALCGNLHLAARLHGAKAIAIDLVPEGASIPSLGYPRSAGRAAGLYWDQPAWDTARIALLQSELGRDGSLVAHELAHAIHCLAFTKDEAQLIEQVLRPTFGGRVGIYEAFAIYSEHEVGAAFDERSRRAPGVYGFTRRQWDEDHVFTRFVRKLYAPYRRAAGPGMGGAGAGDWMRRLQR